MLAVGDIRVTVRDRKLVRVHPDGWIEEVWRLAFGARTGATEKKLYGVKGNSFVAIVEFGPRVRARAIMAGGASADPTSKHFADQALR